jgi:hypothetical protein
MKFTERHLNVFNVFELHVTKLMSVVFNHRTATAHGHPLAPLTSGRDQSSALRPGLDSRMQDHMIAYGFFFFLTQISVRFVVLRAEWPLES